MLLACDVGNSSVKLAIYDKEKRIAFGLYPKKDFSCSTDILSLTTKSNLRFDQFDAVYISSVVPQITEDIKKYIETSFNVAPTIISNKSKLSITIDDQFQEEIGQDILVMSSYAYSKFNDEVLIISFGTAPDSPITYTNSPSSIVKLKSFIARFPSLYFFETFVNLIIHSYYTILGHKITLFYSI